MKRFLLFAGLLFFLSSVQAEETKAQARKVLMIGTGPQSKWKYYKSLSKRERHSKRRSTEHKYVKKARNAAPGAISLSHEIAYRRKR